MKHTYHILKTCLSTGVLLVGLSACTGASDASSKSSAQDRAAVDIGDLRDGGRSVQRFQTPEGFQQGDKLVAYEGPGWESDRVGYRLYLDGRNAIDIFGKRSPELVLSSVGRGDDYHAMADWGMDILKVGNSLGAGGFGVLREGAATQIGDAESYIAEVVEDTNDMAHLRVTHMKSEACGGDVVADYVIKGGSRLTDVRISGDCDLPYVAGIVIHPETESFQAPGGDWSVIGQVGQQTLSDDNLGMAIFYRTADVERVGKDSDDYYIVFKSGVEPNYILGAAWQQEAVDDSSEDAFALWAAKTIRALNEKEN